MPGLSNSGSTFRTFVTIFEGKFTKKVEPGTPDAIMRVNKNSKEVWELHYKALEDVYIRNIEKKEHDEYGLSWVITLETDDGQAFDLQIPYSGRATGGLMFRLPNIKIEQPVTLIPSRFKEIVNGVEKFKTYLVVHQFGAKLDPYWHKDNMGDLPQMEQVMIKGKMQWDDTKQMQYIEDMINAQYKPYFDSMSTGNSPAVAAKHASAKPEIITGVQTPLAAIPENHPLKIEYTFVCQSGYKGSVDEYSKLREAYHLDCAQGFTGTILDYEKYVIGQTKASPAIPANPPQAAPPVQPPVTAKPNFPPPPGPKVSATPAGDQNFAGVKGATLEDLYEKQWMQLRNNGYPGSLEDFQAFCRVNGLKPEDVMFTAAGNLEDSSLPF